MIANNGKPKRLNLALTLRSCSFCTDITASMGADLAVHRSLGRHKGGGGLFAHPQIPAKTDRDPKSDALVDMVVQILKFKGQMLTHPHFGGSPKKGEALLADALKRQPTGTKPFLGTTFFGCTSRREPTGLGWVPQWYFFRLPIPFCFTFGQIHKYGGLTPELSVKMLSLLVASFPPKATV